MQIFQAPPEQNKCPIFHNISDEEHFDSWDGKEVEILELIANPEDTTHIDAISMPQFLVKLLETGEINSAYINEIDECFWTPELKAVLAGQDAWFAGLHDNPYTGELATYFSYGQEIAKYKA